VLPGIGTPADLISQPFFAIRNAAPRFDGCFMLQSNTLGLFRRACNQSAPADHTISDIRRILLTAELSARPFRIHFADDNPVFLFCGLPTVRRGFAPAAAMMR